ncbi:hypothetical protein OAJ57_03065 [Alphaproteobacteria bacterium]|nr:hypothetical protein [Alphaproteobacteria bacterium]
MPALDAHIENLEDSDIFNDFATFSTNHHFVSFTYDYLHMISLGT